MLTHVKGMVDDTNRQLHALDMVGFHPFGKEYLCKEISGVPYAESTVHHIMLTHF